MKRKLAAISALALCLFAVPMTSSTVFADDTTATEIQADDDSILTVSVIDGDTGELRAPLKTRFE